MNTLADFPPDRFAIHAFCTCGHRGQVDTSRLPLLLPMDAFHARLRCQVRVGREVSIRIVWTAAGGFKYSSIRHNQWHTSPERNPTSNRSPQ